MHIELVGLPGAGKSRFLSDLTSLSRGYASARGENRVAALRFVCAHPRLTFFWLSVIFGECARTHTWSLLRYKLSLFAHTCAQTARAAGTSRRVVVDEGFAQRTLSFFETKQTAEGIKRALAHTVSPDVYIEIVGQEPLFGRYDRDDTPRARMGEEYLRTWEAVARHNYRLLVDALATSAVPCHTYNWTRDTVSDVASYLHTL